MPGAAERALLRRRLRRQRRVREALLLDLGALVYELHRQGKRAPDLLQEKAGELTMVDDEVRSLEEALGDGGSLEGLLATGIAGSCASCGALLNAGDAYCARCGAPAQVRAEDTAEWDAGEGAEPGGEEPGWAERGGGESGGAEPGGHVPGDQEPGDEDPGSEEPGGVVPDGADTGDEEAGDDEDSRA